MPPMPTIATLTVSLGAWNPLPSTCRGTMTTPAPAAAAVETNERRVMPDGRPASPGVFWSDSAIVSPSEKNSNAPVLILVGFRLQASGFRGSRGFRGQASAQASGFRTPALEPEVAEARSPRSGAVRKPNRLLKKVA
jgi:hypothetical protein